MYPEFYSGDVALPFVGKQLAGTKDYTTPLKTAIIFVSVVVFMDFFPVALLIEKSFAMFASLLGTWIPWALLFTSTYLTGLYVTRQTKTTTAA
jgi:hypothetical protein